MKIVCDNCATKYSIADEKVRGKVFKIRCKKCSHIIVVRGNEGGVPQSADGGFPADEDQATVAADRGTPASGNATGDAVWHLVIDREQVGPLSPPEVRAKFSAGEIDAETYAWKEGFADWLRLGSIDEFRDLGAAPEGATRRTDSADLFGGGGDDAPAGDAGADLFGGAAAPAPSQPEVFSSASSGAAGGLFGAPEQQEAPAPAPRARVASNPPAAFQTSAGGAAQEAVDARPGLTGQRNENSVLFSLNNLQALASGTGPSAKPASGGGGGGESRPGFANSQTEGSGLIDIRAMAASTLAASPATKSSSSGADDGPAFAPAPIFSPMAAPILMPAAPSGPPKWMMAVIGIGALAVIGIIVVGVLLLTRKPEAPLVAVAPVAPVAAPVPAAPLPTAAPAPTAAPNPATAPAPAPAATDTKATAPATDEGSKKHVTKTHDKGAAPAAKTHDKGAAPTAAPAPAPEAAPAAAPAPKKKKGDALDDLLDGASPDKPAPKSHAAAAPAEDSGGADLKDNLDKSDIVGGMSKIKGKVAACYDLFKVPGLANVSVTIGGNGHVSNASVQGSFAGTPTGSCVEKAVKSASFPKAKNSQTIQYPFMLR